MTFFDFWNNNKVTSIFCFTNGGEFELEHNTETDCYEDYCDLGEWVYEHEFLNDLTGEVEDGKWIWDGKGEPSYLGNFVRKFVAYTA